MELLSVSKYVGLGLDIFVLIILAGFAIVGCKRGFLKSVIALFSTLVIFAIACYFAKDFANWINKFYDFNELITNKLSKSIEKLNPILAGEFPNMSGSDFYSNYIASSDINIILKKIFQYILKPLTASEINGVNIAKVLASAIASIIMVIISAIILYILIKLVILFISRLFDNISRTKVLGGLDKLFGFVFGAIKGVVIVLFFVVLTIILSFIPALNKKIYPFVQNETYIVKYSYNQTDKLIQKYVIDKDKISKWVNDIWNKRYINSGDETPAPATPGESLDSTITIESSSFNTEHSTTITIDNSGTYYYSFNAKEIISSNFKFSSTPAENVKLYSNDNVEILDYSNLDFNNIYKLAITNNSETAITIIITLI